MRTRSRLSSEASRRKGKEIEADSTSEAESIKQNQYGEAESSKRNREAESTSVEESMSEEEESEKSTHEEESNKEVDEQPMKPLNMFFKAADYSKACKLSTRYYIAKAVDVINKLSDDEKRWFHEHPQFRHFFHMPKAVNHKLKGMWMLFLRTASTDKKRECWFVVNGVPIRYSLREHALISGLDCSDYPDGYLDRGSFTFVNQHFKDLKGNKLKVTYERVEEMLLGMDLCEDRLKMAILFFLSSVVVGKSKTGKKAVEVEPFFQRVVDDVDFCRTFPWRRYSFADNLKETNHMMDHMQGVVKPTWTFPSFCIPLEVLAFEAIPKLNTQFREHFESSPNCPRMCRSKFKRSSMKGFILEDINDALGDTNEIQSVLETCESEEVMLGELMEGSDDEIDTYDSVVQGWKTCLAEDKQIWWEDMFKEDVEGRKEEVAQENEGNVDPTVEPNAGMAPGIAPGMATVLAAVDQLKSSMCDRFKSIHDKFDAQDGRITEVENFVKECKQNAEKDAYGRDDHWDFREMGNFSGERTEDAGERGQDSGKGAEDGTKEPAEEPDVMEEEAVVMEEEPVVQEKEPVVMEEEHVVQEKEHVVEEEHVVQEEEHVVEEKPVVQEEEHVLEEEVPVVEEDKAGDVEMKDKEEGEPSTPLPNQAMEAEVIVLDSDSDCTVTPKTLKRIYPKRYPSQVHRINGRLVKVLSHGKKIPMVVSNGKRIPVILSIGKRVPKPSRFFLSPYN